MKKSFVIFICTFDIFGLGRHIYTFENRCIEQPDLTLGDDTVKIILNTKGTKDDVSPEMIKLLSFIDGKAASDKFTKELEKAVKTVRDNEKWRLDYMTLQMSYQEKYEQGLEKGFEQGTMNGINALILDNLEDGKDIEVIKAKLIKRFGLSEERAVECINTILSEM